LKEATKGVAKKASPTTPVTLVATARKWRRLCDAWSVMPLGS
jgi:hypothetical protein